MDIQFLGAAGTVTGSRYLVTEDSRRVLVECGLFQGVKQLRLRNWARFQVAPGSIDAVVLTHAHLDHSGYLPLLARNGFRGPVYCTPATRDLCAILLPDSARLQEEEAAYANRHGYSKHRPALPLYTVEDAQRCLRLMRPVGFNRTTTIVAGMELELLPAGHILGAAMALLSSARTSCLFSGDLGRPDDALMEQPAAVSGAEHLVIESTYGNRSHGQSDPAAEMAAVIARTAARGGAVIIPAFAVERAQEVLYYLHVLKAARRIPDLPVYLNSPLAAAATRVFRSHVGAHRLTREQCDEVFGAATIVETTEESRRLNKRRGPMVIIAGSGMATGGRVIHHLEAFAPDERNAILFVGFQAAGTRGATLVEGASEVKIHGRYVPVRAEVVALDGLSGHADAGEIMRWLGGFERPPLMTYITHGEPVAADALRRRIEETLRWPCLVPDYLAVERLETQPDRL